MFPYKTRIHLYQQTKSSVPEKTINEDTAVDIIYPNARTTAFLILNIIIFKCAHNVNLTILCYIAYKYTSTSSFLKIITGQAE